MFQARPGKPWWGTPAEIVKTQGSSLDEFEAAMTEACLNAGLPMIFIQPGAPGHKEQKKRAIKMMMSSFGQAAIKPCEHNIYQDGCQSCEY